jgi:hypothetical protein
LPARKNWAPDDELGLFRGRSRLRTPVAHVLFSDKHQNNIILVLDTTSNYGHWQNRLFTGPLSGGSVFLGAKFRQNAENEN